jgi:hypothetical protein
VVSRVCLGEVRAIFGLEVARPAHSNADLARLLELARLTDTLVIDTDGMYCAKSRGDHVQTKACRSVGAPTVDQIVAGRLLEVLGPDEVALALAAADEVTKRRQRSTRASELALEGAQYDADRAERALLACEPENRLVARSLESRWEAKLAAVAEAEGALAVTKAAVPALPPRGELESLAADLEVADHSR